MEKSILDTSVLKCEIKYGKNQLSTYDINSIRSVYGRVFRKLMGHYVCYKNITNVKLAYTLKI